MRPVGWILGNLFLWGVKRSRFVQQARRGVEQWKMQDPPAVPN
jgi:beta-hydroxylase